MIVRKGYARTMDGAWINMRRISLFSVEKIDYSPKKTTYQIMSHVHQDTSLTSGYVPTAMSIEYEDEQEAYEQLDDAMGFTD